MFVQCRNNYIEPDNKMGQCIHHDGFVYDCSSVRLKIVGQATTIQDLIMEETQLLNRLDSITNEQKERHERWQRK